LLRPSDWRRPAAVALAGVSISLAALVPAILVATGSSPGSLLERYTLHNVIGAGAAGLVGLLITRRHPGHVVGWLFIAATAASAISLLGGAVGELAIREAVAAGGSLDAPLVALIGTLPRAAYWVSGWTWVFAAVPLFTLVLLYFPNGELPGRRWRVVAAASWSALAILVVGFAVGTTWAYEHASTAEVLAGNYHVGASQAVLTVGFLTLAPAAAGSVASVVVRFRRSVGVERQQIKWLAYGSALAVAVLAASFVDLDVFRVMLVGAVAVVPACAGIAILRYRLYDIDRLVSRSLTYAGMSGILAIIFAGLVVGLQSVLDPFTQGQTLAVAGSTLAVAALFRPLHARIQRTVDARFDRSRVDAERSLGALADRIRSEIDPARIHLALLEAVGTTVRPRSAAVWLDPRRRRS
jgi:hypothetical protein